MAHFAKHRKKMKVLAMADESTCVFWGYVV